MKVTATIRVMGEIDALRTAVVLAMERLCFASAEGFADERPSGSTIDASVAFTGPSSGAVGISIPNEMLIALAADLVPPGEPPPDIASTDLVAELANIICGNVVPRIFGRQVYALSPPDLHAASQPVQARAVVMFGNGWVEATLHGVS